MCIEQGFEFVIFLIAMYRIMYWQIKVWDVQEKKCLSSLLGHTGSVKAISSHPTNQGRVHVSYSCLHWQFLSQGRVLTFSNIYILILVSLQQIWLFLDQGMGPLLCGTWGAAKNFACRKIQISLFSTLHLFPGNSMQLFLYSYQNYRNAIVKWYFSPTQSTWRVNHGYVEVKQKIRIIESVIEKMI